MKYCTILEYNAQIKSSDSSVKEMRIKIKIYKVEIVLAK